MVIEWVLWRQEYEDKIAVKHGINWGEVEEVLYGRMVTHRVGRGNVVGEDLYLGLGQTYEGRYLSIFFILKAGQVAMPISARDMTRSERRQYE
ncbi:MAG: BrnT family toxin [Chloroflexi bacterium]|nr:MAG: BrnT family toxin [Chloroflexota bacterium]